MSLTRRQVTTAALAAVPLAVAVAVAVAATGPASAAVSLGRVRREPTVYLAGDSTAARKYADARPETGWGMALPFFLRSGLKVSNHAVNGRSSKSTWPQA